MSIAASNRLVQLVRQLASRNNNIVDSGELISMGATHGWIQRQVARGWFVPLYRGVYLVGRSVPSLEGTWTAAARAGGPGAVVVGLAGAVHHSMLPAHRAPDVVDVAVRTKIRPKPGVRFRRLGWMRPGDRRIVAGVPVGSAAAVIVSLGTQLSVSELVHLMDRGEFRNRTIAAEVEAILARAPCAASTRIMAAVRRFRDGETGLASGFEFDIDRDLKRLGAPRALINPEIVLVDGHPLRVDRFWPEARLIVEADHTQHTTQRNRSIDLGRDARSELTDLETMRIPSWIPPADRSRLLRIVAERASVAVPGPPIRVVPRGR
jgi:hypothetical protein